MITGTIMTIEVTAQTVRLMTWLSPSFPVGAYSYSHGVEYAVEEGIITDRETLQDWIAHLVRFGSGRTDAVFLRAAHDAVSDSDTDRFANTAAWAEAFRATPEMALETTAQGAAFMSTVAAAWPEIDLEPWSDALAAAARPTAYPLAVGTVAALAPIPVAAALAAYLHAFAANLVSAGVRLVPLGQTDGQRATAALERTALAVAKDIAGLPKITLPEDLGGCMPMADWTSVKHETQYTRLFRS